MPSRDIPADQLFMAEGVITEQGREDGNTDLMPPERRIVVAGTIEVARNPCDLCGERFERCDTGPFGVDSFVVVTWLTAHGHYVIHVVA